MAEITSCWILGAYCGQQCQLILVANRPKWVEIISEGAILFSIETIFGSVNDAVTGNHLAAHHSRFSRSSLHIPAF